MVLDDVADRSRLLVEAGPPLEPERLGHRDLHVVDELAVPDRLEDPVGEAQDEHVLHGFLAEVVVDAEDLLLVEVRANDLVQVAGALEVVAERLLDDQTRPAPGPAPLPHLDDDRLDRVRGDGEVVDAVAARPARLVELVEALDDDLLAPFVGEVSSDVADPLREPLPDVRLQGVAAVLDHRLAHALAELLRGHLGARHADDGELLRQQVADCEGKERREELPLCQVARGAEDRERARLRRSQRAQAFEERVLDRGVDLGHSAAFASAALTA